MMNKGLERPLPENNFGDLHVKLMVDDDIMIVVVNGISLTSRVYQKFGDDLAIAASYGKASFKNVVLRK
jgi:hypothetical protein